MQAHGERFAGIELAIGREWILHHALGKLGLSYSWQNTRCRRAVFYICRTDALTAVRGD